jgi:serine/threonine-protein kinase
MEYVPGPTLREKRDYSVPEITTFYYQVARVLYAMHCVGWLHCDVKPQHLIVTPDKEVKLLDFGQSRKPRDGLYILQGTPDYMAPEQLGQAVDQRTDVYGLGASFYWVLTGESNRPAMAMVGASLNSGFSVGFNSRAKSVREQNPAVPEPLERLILDSCDPNPCDRPGSMREIIERLERILPN